jgi:hypothetical protein
MTPAGFNPRSQERLPLALNAATDLLENENLQERYSDFLRKPDDKPQVRRNELLLEVDPIAGRLRRTKPWASDLFDVIGESLDKVGFTAVHLSLAFNKLARRWRRMTAEEASHPAVDRMVKRAQEMLSGQELQVAHIANLFWAIGKLRHVVPELRAALLEPLVLEVPFHRLALDATAIANIVWGLGVVGADGAEVDGVLDMLCEEASYRLPQMRSSHLAQMLWGLALLGRRDEVLLGSLADTATKLIPVLTEDEVDSDVPQMMVCFAKLDFFDERLVSTVSRRILSSRISDYHDFGLCALQTSCAMFIEMGINGSVDLHDFETRLAEETALRGFSRDKVMSSSLGPMEWMGAERTVGA